ncbi:MAG TPA: response regulator [Candidatus Binatia bacterium]|nr:response regulator [Candidatus Binatia bacterium]
MPVAVRDTIYIVDDDEGVRDSARALLESYDLAVEDFASARDFLAAFDEEVGGCLLLDLNMPEMGGFELLEVLRERHVNIPVIIVTAQGDAAAKERARRAGAFALLEKPVDDSLLKTIEKALAA